MSLLSACQLASMRRLMTSAFATTVAVQRRAAGTPTGMSGPGAGKGGAWATVATYRGDLKMSTVSPRERGNQPAAVATWRATLPWNADVRPADRLLISGVTYDVIETNSGDTERLELTVYLERTT